MIKYVACAVPLFFGIEILSWLFILLISVMALYDLVLKIDEEKGGKF